MSHVSLVDAAMPGMLPVINKQCVRQAVKTGLGLKAEINKYSVFDRKNYFYPDLPQGYQISQFKHPIVGEGIVKVTLKDGSDIFVRIERLHLEQDAGKSFHDIDPQSSYIDLNRSGVALMEIVTKPDLRSADEAKLFVTKLRTILRYLETCDGNMEEGSLRADINVSVRKPGDELGTRCEIKNVNSIKFIGMAIDYESRRQIDEIESGNEIVQETRLFDVSSGKTRSMRNKEEAHDYRYFPDPDLLPLTFSQDFVDEIAATLPELPDDKKARFMTDYGLSAYDAGILVAEAESAAYFEAAATGRDAKAVANMVIGSLFAGLNKAGLNINDSPVSPENLGALVDLLSDDTISSRIAKDVFEMMFEDGPDQGKAPSVIVEEKGLKQVTDTGAIEAAVDEVLAANPDKVAQAKEKPKMAGWFVGQVMQSTGGKANPQSVNKLVLQKLGIEE